MPSAPNIRNTLWGAIGGLCLIWCAVPISITESQATLRVRAATRIDIRTQDAMVIATLRDDRGNPIANQPILLILRPDEGAIERIQYQTGVGGEVEHALTRGQGYEVRVEYVGTAHLVGHVVAQQIVAGQQTLRVTLDLPNDGRLNLDVAHQLTARVVQDAPDTQLELRDELGRTLVRGRTSGGALVWTLSGSELGAEGAGYLRVSSPDDPRITSVEVPIIRYRPSNLSIESSSSGRLQGVLSSSSGPLRRRAIGVLRRDGALLATVLTDQHGIWVWEDPDGVLTIGPIEVKARFESDGPGFPSAESEALQLGEIRGLSWYWFLLPLALAAIAAWWSKRERPPLIQRGSTLPGVSIGKVAHNRAVLLEISGTIQDAHQSGQNIGFVRAQRHDSPDAQTSETDENGQFLITLEAGSWVLRFESDRCRPVSLDVTLPHRGEYSSMVVRMETWRGMSVRVLRTTAARLRGKPVSPHVTVHQLGKTAQLHTLGLEVEQIAYGDKPINDEEMKALETHAKDIGPPPAQQE